MITPVILCGGSGTRLWPLSRKSYPKQFGSLLGKSSLFQATALRLSGPEFTSPVILTNDDFRFIVTEQLSGADVVPGAVMIEPDGRNTAPAILAAALQLHKENPDTLMLVAPSDHNIPDAESFCKTVLRGVPAANDGKIVTFGISPTHPATGYGYLELSHKPVDLERDVISLNRFVEKPNEEEAVKMLAQGNYLWNAGIFLFATKTIIEAFQTHCHSLMDPVARSVEQARTDLNFLRLGSEAWAEVDSISIDYAVMEKSQNLVAVPYFHGWSDLGDWNSVWRESTPDKCGVAQKGNTTAIDCQNTLLRSEDDSLEVVGLGLNNIVAVAMPDAVLVADSTRTQDVKLVVDELIAKQVKQSTQFPRDHRPWGYFDSLAMGDRFQVKRIVVEPGAALSMQSHHHRAEHWIVVEGTAEVTVEDEVKLVGENESVYVPLGAKHRLANPGKLRVTMIEIQTGGYLGEDDIVRYEDVYSRS